MANLKQSTAYTRTFFMVSSTDHLSAKTGAAPTVNVSKAGAAFGAAGGAVTEIANGWYKIVLSTTDTNTLGDLSFHITGTGADDADFADQVIAVDVMDAAAFGLSRLDAAVSSRMATFTLPANFAALSISAGGLVDILQTAADKVWSTATRALTDKIGFALSAAGVQAIWDALTSALTTVGSVGKRIADDLDTAVSSRSTYAGADTSGTTTLLGRLTAGRATNLDNLDATVSSRSTYAGADTAGTTTLLTRVPGVVPVAADYTAARATKLDNLDAAVSSRGTSTLTTADTIGADVKKINGTVVNGNGSTTPWGPQVDGGTAWKSGSWTDSWKLGAWPTAALTGPVWKCGVWVQSSWNTLAWLGWALCGSPTPPPVVNVPTEHLWRGARLRARRR